VVGGLGKLNEVVGTECITEHILPELQHLAEDVQWRVRLAMSHQFPPLGQALGEAAFDSYLTEMLMHWLSDPVFAIRQSACKVCRALVVPIPYTRKPWFGHRIPCVDAQPALLPSCSRITPSPAASDDKQTLNVFLTTQLVFYLRPHLISIPFCVSWCGPCCGL
jgi:hypothetical protein